jgi:hypothetical protein
MEVSVDLDKSDRCPGGFLCCSQEPSRVSERFEEVAFVVLLFLAASLLFAIWLAAWFLRDD